MKNRKPVYNIQIRQDIQRRTPSLHHSSRKSHCLCAAFACGGNLGPGVWFGLRFRLGSDCVSVSVEVPIGVCFGRNHTVVSQSCATCTLRRTALVGKCCQGHIQTIAPLSGASCCKLPLLEILDPPGARQCDGASQQVHGFPLDVFASTPQAQLGHNLQGPETGHD